MQSMYKKDFGIITAILKMCDDIYCYHEEGKNTDEMIEDKKTFNAILLSIMQVGEFAKKLSDGFRNEHAELEWSKITGMRDRIAHDYFGIDKDVVKHVLQDEIGALTDALLAIIREAMKEVEIYNLVMLPEFVQTFESNLMKTKVKTL